MHGLLLNTYDAIMNFITELGPFGPILACVLIGLESIFPVIPLFVFITFVFLAFGRVLGFIISYIFTVLGCLLAYQLVKKYFSGFVYRKIGNKPVFKKSVNYVENLNVQKITVLLSIPFTPAFMVNIAAGLAKMDFKKFLTSILISKVFLVYFWGEVGTSLIESFKNPESLIKVVLIVAIAYFCTMILKKIFKLN